MADVRLIHADCLDAMRALEAESIDAVVCDPPYGLSFMAKGWDHGVPDMTYWAEALRVAKPGAHLVAFGGTRTFHRLTVAIEDAGWEIRDCLSWLYGSGFPKSKNLDGGRGTALKPAWEPILLARKPLVGTVAANVLAHGTGALNIDGCRLGSEPSPSVERRKHAAPGLSVGATGWTTTSRPPTYNEQRNGELLGRWPANVALDEEAAAMLGAQARFFYCAKAARSERNRGCEALEPRPQDASRDEDARGGNNPRNRGAKPRSNSHPTVKPLDLMRWLVRLVCPPHGTVLDPFAGSGTTLLAARAEGCDSIGIEREAEYVAIACARLGLDEFDVEEVVFEEAAE